MPPKKNTAESISALSKEDIEDLISRAVNAAVHTLTVDLNAHFDSQFDKLNKIQENLESENRDLKTQLEKLQKTVDVLTTKLDETSSKMDDKESQIIDALKWSNRNEQYSRRHNIKIQGLEVDENQDYRLAVSNLLTNKLGIHLEREDILVAHPIPKKSTEAIPKSNPVIVTFSPRAVQRREETLKRRRQLKGTKTVIYEDLTQMNLKLINRLKNNVNIKNAWSVNGKVIGLTKSNVKIRFEPYDDISSKLEDYN